MPLQFPDGVIPSTTFEAYGVQWQLLARTAADGRKVLHLATPAAAPQAAAGTETPQQQQQQPLAKRNSSRRISSPDTPQQAYGMNGNGDYGGGARGDYGGGGPGARGQAQGVRFDSPRDHGSASPTNCSDYADEDYGYEPEWNQRGYKPTGSGSFGGPDGSSGMAATRRKYVRDIVIATNPAHDSLGRYKALIALIEHCKARARGLRPSPSTDWGREPANSLLHAIVDVGEALAGFGNAHFPERSGEARAVLAADYKALLSEYLRHLGGVLVPGACKGLDADVEVGARREGCMVWEHWDPHPPCVVWWIWGVLQ